MAMHNKWGKFCQWVDGEEWCRVPEKEAAPHEHHKHQPMNHVDEYRIHRRFGQAVGGLFCLMLAAVLIAVVIHLPSFGDPSNPTNNEVAQHYIEKGLEETGSANLVGGMILSYRVFDTFGESSVLFLAATCVAILLRRDEKNTTRKDLLMMEQEERQDRKDKDTILRTAVLMLTPVAALVGIYVMLFGHLSPGGGFAGGSILGAGLVLYSRVFGSRSVHKFFDEHIYHLVKVVCLMCYGTILIYYVFTGVNGMDNHIWLGIPGHIISSGIIMPINVLVGFEVACTIYAFYALFSEGEV